MVRDVLLGHCLPLIRNNLKANETGSVVKSDDLFDPQQVPGQPRLIHGETQSRKKHFKNVDITYFIVVVFYFICSLLR